MAAPFDNIKKSIWEKVESIFSEPASWTPLGGAETFQARVLFKDPAAEYKLAGIEFAPRDYYMEYLGDDKFPGLAARVNDRTLSDFEIITINGSDYQANYVMEMRDGDVTRIKLTPVGARTPTVRPRP